MENVEKIELQVKQTWFKRNFPTFAVALTAVTAMAVSSTASAEGIAATILAAVTGEVTAITNSQEAIYGLLIVVLVGFLVWRYSKRTVNSG